jgi:Carboxylesterase family
VLPATYIETPQRFQPFLDGKIIPVDPLIAGSKVPLIAGSSKLFVAFHFKCLPLNISTPATMEGTLFTIAQFTNPLQITQADYAAFLNYTFGSLAANVSYYYPISAFDSPALPGFYAISSVLTDSYFKCPARRALLATTKAGIPAWTYLFDLTPTCGWIVGLTSAAVLKLLGPTHTSDIPFVFGEVADLPLPGGSCLLDTQEVGISDVLVSAWTSMAESGSPGSGAGIVGGPWPQYSANGSQGLLIGNGTAIGYVNYTVCDFWDLVAAAQNSSGATSTGSGRSTASSTSGAPGASSTSGGTRISSPVISESLLIIVLVVVLGFIL